MACRPEFNSAPVRVCRTSLGDRVSWGVVRTVKQGTKTSRLWYYTLVEIVCHPPTKIIWRRRPPSGFLRSLLPDFMNSKRESPHQLAFMNPCFVDFMTRLLRNAISWGNGKVRRIQLLIIHRLCACGGLASLHTHAGDPGESSIRTQGLCFPNSGACSRHGVLHGRRDWLVSRAERSCRGRVDFRTAGADSSLSRLACSRICHWRSHRLK